MSGQINWGKLYEQGRCREVGISWTEEEAIEVMGTKTATADEVRARYYPWKIAEMKEAIKEYDIEEKVDSPIIEEIDSPIIEEKVEEDIIVEKVENTWNLDKLKQEATDLWIKFHPNIWEEKLQQKINDANS